MIAELVSLRELQEADRRVADLDRRLAAMPRRRAALDEELDSARAEVEGTKAALADAEALHRKLERELDAMRDRVAKDSAKMWNVKTNRELEALRQEIEDLERSTGEQEEKILMLLEEIDELTGAVARGEERLRSIEREIDGRRRALASEEAHATHDLATWQARREAARAAVPEKWLKLYQRIARGRAGLAVVPVEAGACGGCHVALRPQLYAEVRLGRQILQCDGCKRILYYDPALDPEHQDEAEEEGAGAGP